MAAERPFWSPYRKGIVLALLAWSTSLAFIIHLLGTLTRQMEFRSSLFGPLLFAAWFFGSVFHARRWHRFAPARCEECSKSVFLLTGGETFAWDMQLWWPERECSECGADLTGGRRTG